MKAIQHIINDILELVNILIPEDTTPRDWAVGIGMTLAIIALSALGSALE